MEWKTRLTLGLNIAKNTDYIKKSVKQKLFRIKFQTKNSGVHISISFRKGGKRLRRLPFLKYYNVLEWESRFTLGLNTAKKKIKKSFKKKLFRIKFPPKKLGKCIPPSVVELGTAHFPICWVVKNWLTDITQGDMILHK